MTTQFNITTNEEPDPTELMNLFAQTTWAKKRSVSGIRSLLDKTDIFVVIRDEQKLIGYGRAITDGIYRALIDDIVIDKSYRNKGLGGEIVKELLQQLQNVDQVFLNTRDHLEVFYKKHGFERSKGVTMRIVN